MGSLQNHAIYEYADWPSRLAVCSSKIEVRRAAVTGMETHGHYHTIIAARVLREVDHIVEFWIRNSNLSF